MESLGYALNGLLCGTLKYWRPARALSTYGGQQLSRNEFGCLPRNFLTRDARLQKQAANRTVADRFTFPRTTFRTIQANAFHVSTSEYSQTPESERPAPAVGAEEVQRAKREIQALVQEVSELSRSDISPLEFYDKMLNKVVAALAAPGGAVWTVADNGGMQLTYQIDFRQTGLVDDQNGQLQHGRLLRQVLEGTEGAVVAPHSGAGEVSDNSEDAASNPTDFLLVLAPVFNDQGPQGVVEIFQRPGARIATQRGYLRFLLQICEFAGDFLRHLAEKQTLWEQLETFTRTAHEKLDVRQTAYTIANEGRRLIGCDRVSVAILRGSRCRIEAVSGQDTFDKRSNVTTLLGKLATAVTRTSEDVWYSGDTSDMAPQVEEALDAYVDEAHTKAIAILPLAQPGFEDPAATAEEQEENVYRKPPPMIGALLVEQMVDSRPPEGFMQRVEVVRSHSATALANALEFEGLFLMPLWRLLGKSTKLFRGRTLPKTLLVLALVIGAVAAAIFVPYDFTLEGGGRLRPEIRRNVYAQLDGDVKQVLVEHDSQVTKDQLLVVQRSVDLDKQWEEVNGQLMQTNADLESTNRELINDEELSEADKTQKVAHLGQLNQRAISLREQRRLLDLKKEMLEVRSPIDGRVVTWKLQEQLLGMPVGRGQRLMEIADPEGDWELEVSMPEARMGHIAEAWEKSDGDLRVAFILATHPADKFEGRVMEIHRSAEVRGEEGNVVLLRVAFDQQALRDVVSNPKIGAEATVKVYCGKESIGYVWLHDLINFIRAKILFRL
jgi:hypothetical protein